MKRFNIIISLLTALLVISCGEGAGDEIPGGKTADLKRYPVKSGIIEFEISGSQSGRETLYFDDYGMREAKYTRAELSVGGETRRFNALTLITPEWIYAVDLSAGNGTKIRNTLYNQLAERFGEAELVRFGELMLTEVGAEKIGSEPVAGKQCDVWLVETINSRTWLWNQSLTLKTEASLSSGQILIEAVSFQENVPVPDEKFVVPAGIELEESSDVESLFQMLMKPGA